MGSQREHGADPLPVGGAAGEGRAADVALSAGGGDATTSTASAEPRTRNSAAAPRWP
ncbi:hypothetical protein [Sorangium sp. So ce131]|uniref:hypothetical protein n=1 Tax=Sorangium sp. So ce131 TaxID=3133282 RepID=UPI003F62D749